MMDEAIRNNRSKQNDINYVYGDDKERINITTSNEECSEYCRVNVYGLYDWDISDDDNDEFWKLINREHYNYYNFENNKCYCQGSIF